MRYLKNDRFIPIIPDQMCELCNRSLWKQQKEEDLGGFPEEYHPEEYQIAATKLSAGLSIREMLN